MAVSQKQIAERLGVSIALVSRVLSGKAREVGIAASTMESVLATAREMGYVPSAAALTLKGKSARTMGVVVYDFRDPFFGPIIEKLQGLAHERGYSLVLAGFKGRQPDPSDLAPLRKHAIDGLIVLGSAERSDWLNDFRGLPVARIGHGANQEPSVRISIDELDAARKIIGRFVAKGWRRFAFIGAGLFVHSLRFHALKKAAGENAAEIERHVGPMNGFEAGLWAAEYAALEGAVCVCATDVIAMGALRALRDSNRVAPVIGFDDIPAAARFIPPLTTVRQPIGEMVKHAFDAVVESAAPTSISLPGELIARSSA